MGYAKERGKLEQLLTRINNIGSYDEKNLANLVDGHEKYSHTIRILKNKEPETFINLYEKELQEVKDGKKLVKESDSDEARQNNFTVYKDAVIRAIEKTIKATKESL
ncbi:hypothetical protein [Pedobacter metabolipauper]|uniref:Uncharacterized protein n=1 Tax=Pedobacter metabolipauper TaxID=425513 RepID=A0A4R6SVL9_9SPHI|nr:hypothetical protein [Pedobacter metabolipauper]TDQ08411.1 hypothetical protein ATK78_2924 [Pedobacter metabolipauper]